MWSDERILEVVKESGIAQSSFPVRKAQEMMWQMRKEYDARIAELEGEVKAKDGYIDDLEAQVAELQGENEDSEEAIGDLTRSALGI